jgi:sn-glycerol 3-phosphate transport system ATP-binding protein
MNLLPGNLETGGVAVAGAVLPSARGEAGRRVVVGLRPEHLESASDGPLSVRVELLERLGADTILHGSIDGSRLTARVPGSFASELGSTVAFAIRPEHIHLFDPDTGKRI